MTIIYILLKLPVYFSRHLELNENIFPKKTHKRKAVYIMQPFSYL